MRRAGGLCNTLQHAKCWGGEEQCNMPRHTATLCTATLSSCMNSFKGQCHALNRLRIVRRATTRCNMLHAWKNYERVHVCTYERVHVCKFSSSHATYCSRIQRVAARCTRCGRRLAHMNAFMCASHLPHALQCAATCCILRTRLYVERSSSALKYVNAVICRAILQRVSHSVRI